MTKLLRRAFEELRKLPPAQQDAIAAVMLRWMEALTAPRLTPSLLAELRTSLAERSFLSEEETQALYRRYGV